MASQITFKRRIRKQQPRRDSVGRIVRQPRPETASQQLIDKALEVTPMGTYIPMNTGGR